MAYELWHISYGILVSTELATVNTDFFTLVLSTRLAHVCFFGDFRGMPTANAEG